MCNAEADMAKPEIVRVVCGKGGLTYLLVLGDQ